MATSANQQRERLHGASKNKGYWREAAGVQSIGANFLDPGLHATDESSVLTVQRHDIEQ